MLSIGDMLYAYFFMLRTEMLDLVIYNEQNGRVRSITEANAFRAQMLHF